MPTLAYVPRLAFMTHLAYVPFLTIMQQVFLINRKQVISLWTQFFLLYTFSNILQDLSKSHSISIHMQIIQAYEQLSMKMTRLSIVLRRV